MARTLSGLGIRGQQVDNFCYHFSENPNIDRFKPQSLKIPVDRPQGMGWLNGSLVWAIDAKYSPLYLFPRECPRILMMKLKTSTKEDIAKYGLDPCKSFIAFIENEWVEKIENTKIYRYTFNKKGFRSLNDVGMQVSENTVLPIDVHEINDIFSALKIAKVEIRAYHDLSHLSEAWESSLHVSGIRLRNARNWRRDLFWLRPES